MHDELSLQQIQNKWHGTLKSYVIGFIAAVLLTAASFSLVLTRVLSGRTLIFAIVGLALVQAIVQLLFFLHLKIGSKLHWDTIVFYFMLLVLLIIAGGSMWIMYDLNDRVMSNMTMDMPHD